MYRLRIFIFALSLCSCKNVYTDHPVKYMYNAPYDKQVLIAYPFLEKPENAKTLAITLLTIYFADLNINLQTYDSITATSVNKNDIWKIKIIRHETIDNVQQPVHYLAYVRKKDGALLLARKEIGEFIGSTDIEERFGVKRPG